MRDDLDFMRRISLDLAARKAACQILDIEEDADQKQLKRAYRLAAIRHHPDHNGNTAEANRMFALIKCAYELLAFDKTCDLLLADMDSRPDVPKDDRYRLDNPWGHFCWWRQKFFEV
jgi:preprotein translocase subunit Sec63